jgi:hypothetical protein
MLPLFLILKSFRFFVSLGVPLANSSISSPKSSHLRLLMLLRHFALMVPHPIYVTHLTFDIIKAIDSKRQKHLYTQEKKQLQKTSNNRKKQEPNILKQT